MIDENKLKEFTEYYLTLTETEKFKVGTEFNKETGGKLSPYNSPNPVSVGLIQVQDDDGEIKLLGIIRGIPPGVGGTAFPGGFVDKFEDPQVAAAREVLEETGLETNPEDYMCVGSKTNDRNVSLYFFLNKTIYPKEILSTLTLNSEVLGFNLINKETEMVFPFHKEQAVKFFESQTVEKKSTPKMK